jgi:predicted lipoprotein with Yx(FWY)xxD motif
MRHARRTGLRMLAVGAALALLLAACGGDDDDDAASSATTTSTDGSTTSTSSESGGAVTVAIAETRLGDTLVDAQGKTLYLFENDSDNKSVCNAGCDSTWPPLVVTGTVVVGDGLTESMFTTFPRDDGTMQVSVNGHPLYTYGPDAKPGDTNGQDVGDVWYAVGTNGQKIEGEAEGATSTTSGNSGGSGY